VLYLANLIFALLLTLPFWAMVDSFGGRLVGGLDVNFLIELTSYNETALAGLVAPMLFVAAVYVLASLFFSGGALAVLSGGEGYRPLVFWGQAAKLFGRFLRLLAWSLLVLATLSLAPLAAYGVQRLVYGSDPYETVVFWGFCLQAGLALVGLFVYRIVLDYARIHAVQTDEKRMRVSLWNGVRFTFRNFGRTFGLALLLLLAGLLAIALYRPIAQTLSASANATVILAMFFLQQLYVLWRTALRVTRYASELELFRVL
jgi:hypothetical protein